jgi:hypothetical protein
MTMMVQFQGQLHFVPKKDNPREANAAFSRASGLIAGVRKFQPQARQDGFHYAISITSENGGTAIIAKNSSFVNPASPDNLILKKGDTILRKLFETNKAFVKRAMMTARETLTQNKSKAETPPISAK